MSEMTCPFTRKTRNGGQDSKSVAAVDVAAVVAEHLGTAPVSDVAFISPKGIGFDRIGLVFAFYNNQAVIRNRHTIPPLTFVILFPD